MKFKILKNPFDRYLLILFSSILYILSFPKFSWSFLVWVAFIPFFIVLENKPALKRFKVGYLTGTLSSLGVFYWLTHSMRHYGDLNTITSFSILFLMALYLALYFGAFAWLWGLVPSKNFFSLFWAPSLWVGLEYLRAHLLTGFPWELMGHSQFNCLSVLQVAELFGVYGVSFLIVLVNQTLYQILWAVPLCQGWSWKWKGTAFTLLLVLLTLAFGYRALSLQKQKDLQAITLKVSVIQGNIDQALKWNPAFQEETIRIYRDLTLRTFPKAPDLIVWPETAAPFYFLNENRLTPIMFQLAQETRAYLLFGSPASAVRHGKMEFYNRAYLLSPEGHLSFYDKVHLVAFGEYIPFRRFLPFSDKIVQTIGDFTPGSGIYGLSHPKGKLGVLICFETIFPELSRAYIQEDCRILVNITNDAWFGRTSAPYQHLSMLTFRAVENRVWIARAANTGFSAFIDSSGGIHNIIPLFQTGETCATIPLRGEKTFYNRYGDLPVVFCGIIFLLGIIFRIINRHASSGARYHRS